MRWPRRKREEDLDRELRAHLDLEAEEQQDAGVPPDEARHAARRAFGNEALVKEDTRAVWTWTWLEHLGQDLRYAGRMIRKNPGFSAVTIACLALGIGANTAIFSLLNAVMLKSLPVTEPGRLVLLKPGMIKPGLKQIRTTQYGYGFSLGHFTFEQIRENSQTLSSVFAFVPFGFGNQSVTVNIGGQASLAAGEMVSGEYFSGLGVSPLLGRAIVNDDQKSGAPQVAVISHAYWSRQFGRDASVIGGRITLNGVPATIAGVAPPDFSGVNPGMAIDIWVPLRDQPGLKPWSVRTLPGESMFAGRTLWWLMVMGRLKSGVTEEQARAETDLLFRQAITAGLDQPPPPEDLPRIEFDPAGKGLQSLRQRFSKPLFILMTAVGLVLLIACANVATLLLARATARQREMSVRLATGASRARLIRQLLTESVLLAAAGGAFGLVLAHWGSRALLAIMSPQGQSFAVDPRPDGNVLAFSAAVCLLTGVLFGLAPAFRATRVDLSRGLKESASAHSGRPGWGRALVASQVAVSLLLLTGAALFVRTLQNLAGQDTGFDRRNLLLFAVDPSQDEYPQERAAALHRDLLQRFQTMPGVRSATNLGHALLSGWVANSPVTWTDGPEFEPGQPAMVYWNRAGPGFLETMGIPVVHGRDIEWPDVEFARKAVVVSEAMARHFFPNGNPVGHHVSFGASRDPEARYEIVGVAGDAKYSSPREEAPRTVYVPYTATDIPLGRMHYAVRTAGDPAAMTGAIRQVVRSIDPDLPLANVKTQVQQIDEALTQERMFAQLTSLFGSVALLLVSIGLYGTLAYAVTRRAHELGIRMALGARPSTVRWAILRESLLVILVGVAIGLPAAFGATRFIASQLYGVDPNDMASPGVALLFLFAVGAAAGYLPARRASRIDPMVALRYE